MTRLLSSSQELPLDGRHAASVIGMAAGVAAAAVLVGGVMLWAHYGTTVFFEMLVSGLDACF